MPAIDRTIGEGYWRRLTRGPTRRRHAATGEGRKARVARSGARESRRGRRLRQRSERPARGRGRGRGRHRAFSELAGASRSDKRSAPCAFRGRHSNGATAGPRGYWPKHGKASLVRSSPPPALDALLHVSRRSGSPYKSLMKAHPLFPGSSGERSVLDV